eukprot:1634682-Prymnesium_polylepis.1
MKRFFAVCSEAAQRRRDVRGDWRLSSSELQLDAGAVRPLRVPRRTAAARISQGRPCRQHAATRRLRTTLAAQLLLSWRHSSRGTTTS